MDKVKEGIKEFLSKLPDEDVKSLAKTTAPLITPRSVEDAVVTILRYSDAPTLLHRRKITKNILASYLDKKGVKLPTNCEKSKLVQMVIAQWQRGDVIEIIRKLADSPDKKEVKPFVKTMGSMKFQQIPFYYTPATAATSATATTSATPATSSATSATAATSSATSATAATSSATSATAATPVATATIITSTSKSESKPASVIPPNTQGNKVQLSSLSNRTITLINKTLHEAASPKKVTVITQAAPSQPAQQDQQPKPVSTTSAKSVNIPSTSSTVAPTTTTTITTTTTSSTSKPLPTVTFNCNSVSTPSTTSTSTCLVPYVKRPMMTESEVQTDPTNDDEEEERLLERLENRYRHKMLLGVDSLSVQLGVGWCNWWYERLNSLDNFGPQHFFLGANLRIEEIRNGISEVHEVLWNGPQAAADLQSFRARLGATFIPSVIPIETGGGLQSKISPHGLAQIMVAGVIHDDATLSLGSKRPRDSAKGVFEQVFGIMKDPTEEGHYKVKYTLLRVKDAVTLYLMDKDANKSFDTYGSPTDSGIEEQRSFEDEKVVLEDFD